MNDVRFILSDGMGTFMYIDKCKEDSNFITVEIAEEGENKYESKSIELHKDKIKDIIDKLQAFIEVK